MKAQQWYRAGRCNYFYVSIVAADGTYELGPEDWQVTRTGVGVYSVTHNLGHQKYIPIVMPLGTDYKTEASIASMGDNAVGVAIANNNQPGDMRFGLMIFASQ